MTDPDYTCTRDPTAACGLCKGMACISSFNDTKKSWPCQFNCITQNDSVKQGICNDCNCEDEDIKNYKCPGRYCAADSECVSGKCLHHYCTVS